MYTAKPIHILFILFLLSSTIFLNRVPGLMGDEASEGENVYELLQADHLVVTGERSYIGPAIDYVRVPFIWLFGYTVLGIRVPILLFSIATFWLAWYVLRQVFGQEAALFGIACLVFSPIWWTQQRLGWTITLFPFFIFLILFFVIKKQPLLAGLVAGLGLANHIIFLASLVGTSLTSFLGGLKKWWGYLHWWPVLIGFVGGFGMQFVVLQLNREDQGNIEAATSLFSQRLSDFPKLFPLLISGSSYVASYTGIEFSPPVIWWATGVIVGLALCSWLMVIKKPVLGAVWVGLFTYVLTLIYIIDRFSLRYFVVMVLVIWLLAGLGLSELVRRLPNWRLKTWWPVVLAVLLMAWTTLGVIRLYLQTGGSTADFSLGNRVDSAAALVDTQLLVDCLAGHQNVFSESVHIWNRLQYLSHSDSRLSVLSEVEKKRAEVLVTYRLPKDVDKSKEGELCPELAHFRVLGP